MATMDLVHGAFDTVEAIRHLAARVAALEMELAEVKDAEQARPASRSRSRKAKAPAGHEQG